MEKGLLSGSDGLERQTKHRSLRLGTLFSKLSADKDVGGQAPTPLHRKWRGGGESLPRMEINGLNTIWIT